MPLFGERRACQNCGLKMKEPTAPEAFLCPNCHHPGPWASPEQVETWRTWQDARGRYREALAGLVGGSGIASAELTALAPLTGLSEKELQDLRVKAFIGAADQAIGDQILTPEEDASLNRSMAWLGVTWAQVSDLEPSFPAKAIVSSINGGMLPEVAEPRLLPKKGEIVHLEIQANLMKEVAIRQYQGGYSGLSIPIGKTGVRYRVGGVRGRMVQVGTELQAADSGILAITNKRAVYMGSKKTIDMPLPKLVNLNVFSDGLQFHMSNRVNPPLFQLDQSEIVAAIVNAAAQRLE
jgi:hypothetical protein